MPLTGEGRWRHLSAHPREMRGRIEKVGAAGYKHAENPEKKICEGGKRMSEPGKESQVCPGIDVLLLREQKNTRLGAPGAELRTVTVPVPSNSAQERAINQTKCDQVATAAMIRAEDELIVLELFKGAKNVARSQAGTIAPDRGDLVVAESVQPFDRVLEALAERRANLAMELFPETDWVWCRRKEMDVRESARRSRRHRGIQHSRRSRWQAAPGEIERAGFSENQNGATWHGS